MHAAKRYKWLSLYGFISYEGSNKYVKKSGISRHSRMGNTFIKLYKKFHWTSSNIKRSNGRHTPVRVRLSVLKDSKTKKIDLRKIEVGTLGNTMKKLHRKFHSNQACRSWRNHVPKFCWRKKEEKKNLWRKMTIFEIS